MAQVVVGTGSTLKATTLEGLLQECCTLLRMKELDPVHNPNNEARVSNSHNQADGIFNSSYNLLVNPTQNDSGQNVLAVPEYLTGLIFSPGTGGTFKSITCAGYLIELVMFAQNLERSTVKNPNKLNYVTGTYNSENNSFSGSITVPIITSINAEGGTVYTADEYLL